MQVLTIREGVLNDDELLIADAGYAFPGRLVAVLEYHTYANEWNNHHHRKGFKTLESAQKYIDKNYPDFDGEIYQEEER